MRSLVLSPILSYADQIRSMRARRSSAGFSLDIPLLMLAASLLKLAYWPGARFAPSLVVQAVVTLAVQVVLLKVALDGRPSARRGGWGGGRLGGGPEEGEEEEEGKGRPWGFWRWREERR